MKYTNEQLAALIDGSEYPITLTHDILAAAKESGLVIIYGESDDLIEMDGAIRDEAGCYNGGDVIVNAKGFVERPTDDEIEVLEKYNVLDKVTASGRKIKAIWDRDGISWQYETDIPHATFKVMEDGDIYCIGIIFDVKELR